MNFKLAIEKYYTLLLAYAISVRVLLLMPILVFCFIYNMFVPPSGKYFHSDAWAAVLVAGLFLYSLSMIVDVFVVLFKQYALKYNLVTIARMFRIVTYFYVGATICNFTYRSYMSVGFHPSLHILTIGTMSLLVALIAFHAFQCKEGLSYGGNLSEKTTW